MSLEGALWANRQQVAHVPSKALLGLLGHYADKESNAAWPSQDTLATNLGVSIKTVQRCLAYLQALGLFDVEPIYDSRHRKVSNRYILHLDVVVAVAKDDPRSAIIGRKPRDTTVRAMRQQCPSQATVLSKPGDTSVLVTPNYNSQENTQMKSHSPSGGTGDLYRHFVGGLARATSHYDAPASGYQDKMRLCGHFQRMLAAGDSPEEIRRLIDLYCKRPADWHGDTRWMDFVSRYTQARLRSQRGNTSGLRLVTEVVEEVGA